MIYLYFCIHIINKKIFSKSLYMAIYFRYSTINTYRLAVKEKKMDYDVQIQSKLYIIKKYLSHKEEKLSIHNIQKELEENNLEKYKPSRIQQVIDLYCNPENNAGLLQPVGKKEFLERFLKLYVSPLFVHYPKLRWTEELLSNYIKMKYTCYITGDSIRKAISRYLNFHTNVFYETNSEASENDFEPDDRYTMSLEEDIYNNALRKKIQQYIIKGKPIYFIAMYKNPFPFREIKYSPTDSKNMSISGFVVGYSTNEKILIEYSREPFFHISYNDKKEFPNLEYILSIPRKPGLFLIEDDIDGNEGSRNTVEQYWKYHFEHKLPYKNNFYFLLNSSYDNSKLLNFFSNSVGLFRPIITEFSTSLSATNFSIGDSLPQNFKKIKELMEIYPFSQYSDYIISNTKKSATNIPKTLPL